MIPVLALTCLVATWQDAPQDAKAATITLAGCCVDASGKPVRGAELSLSLQDPRTKLHKPIRTLFVNAKGRFRFEGLADISGTESGAYLLVARSPEHGTGVASIRSKELPLDDLRILMKDRASVSGVVLGEHGKPLRDAKVWLRGISPRGIGGEPAASDYPEYNEAFLSQPIDGCWTYTDSDGRFRLDGLPAGVSTRIDVSHELYALGYSWLQPPAEARIALELAGTIVGRVVFEETGKPAAGVRVEAQGVEHSDWGCVFADADGRYRIPSLRPDGYNVWAVADGWTVHAHDSFKVDAKRENPAPDLVLVRGTWLRGKVVDQATDKPVCPGKGGCVGIYGPSRPKSGAAIESTLVAADGTWRLRVAPGRNYIYLPGSPGWSQVGATANGVAFQRWLDVKKGADVDVTIVVARIR